MSLHEMNSVFLRKRTFRVIIKFSSSVEIISFPSVRHKMLFKPQMSAPMRARMHSVFVHQT